MSNGKRNQQVQKWIIQANMEDNEEKREL